MQNPLSLTPRFSEVIPPAQSSSPLPIRLGEGPGVRVRRLKSKIKTRNSKIKCRCYRIASNPKGLRLEAQGCDAGATLGTRRKSAANPERVVPVLKTYYSAPLRDL